MRDRTREYERAERQRRVLRLTPRAHTVSIKRMRTSQLCADEADTREHAASGEPCLHVHDEPRIPQPQYARHDRPYPALLLVLALGIAVVATLFIAAMWPPSSR